MHFNFTLLCAFFLLCGAASAQTAEAESVRAAIIKELTRNAETAPGSAAVVIVPGGEAVFAAVGVEDKKTKKPVTNRTRFLSGSTGKTITAVVAVTLIADGVITLDDKLSDYLSDKSWFSTLNNREKISVRMLLNHSAGIPSYLDDRDFFLSQRGHRLKGYTPDDLVSYVAKDDPAGSPGAHFAYSDTHYILLGMIIEKVTGERLYDLAERIIITPIGLTRTTPLIGRDHDQLANAYRRSDFIHRVAGVAGPAMSKRRLKFTPDYEWAGGGFVTSPEDLARFFHALFTSEVFSQQRQIMTAPANVNAVSDKIGYGLGIYVNRRNPEGVIYAHGGDFMGYRSFALFDSASGSAIGVQANAKAYEPVDVGYAILQALKK